MALARRLREGLAALPGVTVYSPPPRDDDVPIVTCTVEGIAPIDVGAILDADYGIAVRTGLHCAPLVHEDLGTADRARCASASAASRPRPTSTGRSGPWPPSPGAGRRSPTDDDGCGGLRRRRAAVPAARRRRSGRRSATFRRQAVSSALSGSRSMRTAQTLNSAVLVTGSEAELVSSLTGDSL